MDHGAHNATLCLDNPFWQYSLRQYALSGCSDFLLAAQDDHDLDINIVLYLGWLVNRGKIFDISLLEQPLAFSNQFIQPLRVTRRSVKPLGDTDLYKHIKKSELMAEQYMQALLYEQSLLLEDVNSDLIDTEQALSMLLSEYLPHALNSDQSWKADLICFLTPK